MADLETYFASFKQGIVGDHAPFLSPYGVKEMIYADWTASGRLYQPIEQHIMYNFGPFVANTHTDSNITGTYTNKVYHHAVELIKNHVHANEHDVLISEGTGMTGAIITLQHILGFKVHEKYKKGYLPELKRPVVFITHMEHHSNQTSWEETIADVVIVPPDKDGMVSLQNLQEKLDEYQDRDVKIGSFTACSNVTGVKTPYHGMAKVMHKNGGLCFVDFAASAPYIDIDMHPVDPLEKLDAIFFSPHKFLGGPGSSGIVIFDSLLYESKVPHKPGGGTVNWTNPWGGKAYVDSIEDRENGGTPGIIQTIKAALAIRLKEKMGTKYIQEREAQLVNYALNRLIRINRLHVLDKHLTDRLGIISFFIENAHYNLIVKLLNDGYGIQVRGGCSCAGTYGHYLLNIDKATSKYIADQIDLGIFINKPGWVRLSLHPTMTFAELDWIIKSIEEITRNIDTFAKDYYYNQETNEFNHKNEAAIEADVFFDLW